MITEEIKNRICKLRQENKMSYRDIANEIGDISHESVRLILQENGIEIENDPSLDDLLEQEENLKTTNLDTRRNWLFYYLFDVEKYVQGDNFIVFLDSILDRMTEVRGSIIRDFYITGEANSPADNINQDTDRVYRVQAREELKDLVHEYPIPNLIVQNVIQKTPIKEVS